MEDATLSHQGSTRSRSRRSLSCSGHSTRSHGRMAHEAICKYSGYIPTVRAENVFGATRIEAGRLGAEVHGCRSRPGTGCGRFYQSSASRALDGTIDGGFLNSTLGSTGDPVPRASSVSGFHNPGGTVRQRNGAAIPGYVGFIPGKYAGNVYGTRYAQANIAANEMRRMGDEQTWPPVSMSMSALPKYSKSAQALARGVGATRLSATLNASAGVADGWRLWEPQTTHERLKY